MSISSDGASEGIKKSLPYHTVVAPPVGADIIHRVSLAKCAHESKWRSPIRQWYALLMV